MCPHDISIIKRAILGYTPVFELSPNVILGLHLKNRVVTQKIILWLCLKIRIS